MTGLLDRSIVDLRSREGGRWHTVSQRAPHARHDTSNPSTRRLRRTAGELRRTRSRDSVVGTEHAMYAQQPYQSAPHPSQLQPQQPSYAQQPPPPHSPQQQPMSHGGSYGYGMASGFVPVPRPAEHTVHAARSLLATIRAGGSVPEQPTALSAMPPAQQVSAPHTQSPSQLASHGYTTDERVFRPTAAAAVAVGGLPAAARARARTGPRRLRGLHRARRLRAPRDAPARRRAAAWRPGWRRSVPRRAARRAADADADDQRVARPHGRSSKMQSPTHREFSGLLTRRCFVVQGEDMGVGAEAVSPHAISTTT